MKKAIVVLVFLFCGSILMAQNANYEPIVTKIILVRHAEKMLDGSKDPELTTEGKQRAERLRFLLSDINVNQIFSSPYKRTKNTVAPVAASKNITIEIYNPKDPNFSTYLWSKVKGETAIVVGHSNSIPALVNQLIGKDKFKELTEDVYSKIWILTYSDEHLIDCSLYNF
ncbi:MAG: hypothetical protein CMP76_09440 [Flavobacterium sp.]|uniref:SixA phosphatase family protein n=1 Tax=Flavobacterium sp. TaxID=239 RepID=UPI000C53CDBF|nr:phosphoglycerate mutase family protein [Flavobacterium sp.]MBF03506.1 hypothetical protein [Flavobacterium sp.]|tara:strand:- start:1751 stop:2260 length:510 start_codon:yes stop_codon:yes gene_type:complete